MDSTLGRTLRKERIPAQIVGSPRKRLQASRQLHNRVPQSLGREPGNACQPSATLAPATSWRGARGDDDFRRHPCSVTHLVTKDDCGYHYDEFLPKNCAAVSASSRSHLSELRPRRIRKSFAGSRDHWTTRHQARGTYGCILSPPGPSVRSSSSRPGPETVVVPVYPAAQLSRACGEATGLHATSAGGDAPVYPGPPLARVRAHRHRAQAQRWLLCRYIRTRNCHRPAVRLLVISG